MSALDGYKAGLDRMLSTPDRPPCKKCDGFGYINLDNYGFDRETCDLCWGTGDQPDDGRTGPDEEDAL